MKKIIIAILTIFMFSGCATTGVTNEEKQANNRTVMLVVGALLVGGAIAASQSNSGGSGCDQAISVSPNGSDHFCQ